MHFNTDLEDLKNQYLADINAACEPIFEALQASFEEETQKYIDGLNAKYKRHHFVLCDVMGQISLDVYKKTGKNAGKRLMYAIEDCSICFSGESSLTMGEFRDLRDTELAKNLQEAVDYFGANCKQLSVDCWITTANTKPLTE